MEQQTRYQTAASKDAVNTSTQDATPSPFAGRPLDGSQYLDVVEEQEYAERRPTPEEQRPRYSYMKMKSQSVQTRKM